MQKGKSKEQMGYSESKGQKQKYYFNKRELP